MQAVVRRAAQFHVSPKRESLSNVSGKLRGRDFVIFRSEMPWCVGASKSRVQEHHGGNGAGTSQIKFKSDLGTCAPGHQMASFYALMGESRIQVIYLLRKRDRLRRRDGSSQFPGNY